MSNLLPPELPWCVEKLSFILKRGFVIAASLRLNDLEVVILVQRENEKYLVRATVAELERAQWRIEMEGSK